MIIDLLKSHDVSQILEPLGRLCSCSKKEDFLHPKAN